MEELIKVLAQYDLVKNGKPDHHKIAAITGHSPETLRIKFYKKEVPSWLKLVIHMHQQKELQLTEINSGFLVESDRDKGLLGGCIEDSISLQEKRAEESHGAVKEMILKNVKKLKVWSKQIHDSIC